jgi:hypothetical protein
MKKIVTVLISLLCVSTAFAASRHNQVRWERVVGVISAINVDNPVADIHSGTFPWSAQSGNARINLSTGAASFKVEGLVIIGTPFSGTPGPITAVTGTLVCNAGEETEAVLDTPKVPLSASGDAIFSGYIPSIPSLCANPIFLIRIADPEGAAGLWIATGADRSGGQGD